MTVDAAIGSRFSTSTARAFAFWQSGWNAERSAGRKALRNPMPNSGWHPKLSSYCSMEWNSRKAVGARGTSAQRELFSPPKYFSK
jgi:hypothetical protein